MRTKNQLDFLKILNANLAENPFYNKLFTAVGDCLDSQIGEQLSQLNRIRSPTHIKRGDYLKTDNGNVGKVGHIRRRDDGNGNPIDVITMSLSDGVVVQAEKRALHDRKILIDGSRFIGFDYYSDFLSDEDYARIYEYVGSYWSNDGKPDFIKFMGFIKNMSLNLVPLWSKDTDDDESVYDSYSLLEEYKSSMKPVWKGGEFYPTSHVEVTYDALLSQTIDNDMIHLFYYLAPIHLVLERLSGSLDLEITYGIIGAADIVMVEAGTLVVKG